LIGNDIIDLNLARQQSNWQRRGFLQKLFNSEEQEFILSAENSEFLVWLFWSMKESVYKAKQREYNLNASFNPKHFNCHLLDLGTQEARGEVVTNTGSYKTVSSFSLHNIHTCTSNTRFTRILKKGDVKLELLQKIAEENNLHLNHLEIDKDSLGIPYCTYLGAYQKIIFSLSHHGAYSSFALHQLAFKMRYK